MSCALQRPPVVLTVITVGSVGCASLWGCVGTGMNRIRELGELWVSWFSFESEFSPRILLCNNFGKVFLNSLWDHSQVTKSLPWKCPEKLGWGARAAVIVVWVWLAGGDLREVSWSGCSRASECSCWGAQVCWGQTCDLSLLLIFVSCKKSLCHLFIITLP